MEKVTNFIFLGSKIIADGDWSNFIAPWKKNCDQPRQHIKKQRRYFADKVLSSQSYGFSSSHVWMCSWTIKKAECQRIDAFELWCWRRLLRVPWTARRSSHYILKRSVLGVHWRDWCWSWNSNTLATWHEELTHWKRPWRWERLKVEEKGTTEDEMVGWHHWFNGHEFE